MNPVSLLLWEEKSGDLAPGSLGREGEGPAAGEVKLCPFSEICQLSACFLEVQSIHYYQPSSWLSDALLKLSSKHGWMLGSSPDPGIYGLLQTWTVAFERWEWKQP